jgi:MoxR-like ATPase
LYLYLGYPDAGLEEAIINLKVPGISRHLARIVVQLVQRIRGMKLKKAPSITETIDWARTLLLLGMDEISDKLVRESLNVLLKYEDDIKKVEQSLDQLIPTVKPEEPPKVARDVQPRNDLEDGLARFNF